MIHENAEKSKHIGRLDRKTCSARPAVRRSPRLCDRGSPHVLSSPANGPNIKRPVRSLYGLPMHRTRAFDTAVTQIVPVTQVGTALAVTRSTQRPFAHVSKPAHVRWVDPFAHTRAVRGNRPRQNGTPQLARLVRSLIRCRARTGGP
jgi:hypothetical protein